MHSDLHEVSKAYFSPGEDCRTAIINEIHSAVRSLKVCVFTISDNQISDALRAVHLKGIEIKIITDNDKLYDTGSDIKKLKREGMDVRIDSTHDHMHHKFMIVDEQRLVNGSYNWTNSAARYNHENVTVTSQPDLVKAFLDEFGKLWEIMRVLELRD